jgi:hypothetical protein
LTLTVVNPAFGSIERPGGEGPVVRVAELSGKTVALFSNNKPNVAPFFDELERRLREEVGAASVVRGGKLSSAFGAAEDDIDAIAGADFAINAIGD